MNKKLMFFTAMMVFVLTFFQTVGVGWSGVLNSAQTRRLQECHRLIQGADGKTFEVRLAEMSKVPAVEDHLQILEAQARTFADIVEEQQVVEGDKKAWLFNMVALNMAYLQLGGLQVQQSSDTALNKMIRWKLKEYLPSALKNNKELFQLVD